MDAALARNHERGLLIRWEQPAAGSGVDLSLRTAVVRMLLAYGKICTILPSASLREPFSETRQSSERQRNHENDSTEQKGFEWERLQEL